MLLLFIIASINIRSIHIFFVLRMLRIRSGLAQIEQMASSQGVELAGQQPSLSDEAAPSLLFNTNAPIASEDFDDDEVFEDAKDDVQKASSIDLQQAFVDCEAAMKKFFNNDLTGAMDIMKPWSRTSLYHSLGTAIFEFIPAVLTFDHTQILRALDAIKTCITICNKNKKQYTFVESIGSIIKKPNYALYTDVEAHAELCYAEALLLQAALTIIEGEDLTGLIKGTIKVKNCYNTYQECWDIKEVKTWDSKESKMHFNSGVRLGTATFNLMISLLPPRIVTLLEFVGFSGNQYYGLTELEKGSRSEGMRSVLCDLMLLAYHLVICQFIGSDGNLPIAERTLQKSLKEYPDSVWFLVFKARLEFLQGRLDAAIVTYNRTIRAQDNFKQFRHLCYWELMWVYGLKLDFRQSSVYADRLLEGSSWSKTTHSYIKGAMLLQTCSDMKHSEIGIINDLFRNASSYKTRIAGKSLPMEKFVLKRCARYEAQGGRLVLPALELMCLWNMFPILTNDSNILQNILRMIEQTREIMESRPREWMWGYEAENRALLYYLHGCCYSAMKLPRLALEKFLEVLKLKKDIKEDTFLLPYAVCEMAMCHFQLGDMAATLSSLNDAKKKYSGYSLESRLHFRVHARVQMVRNVVGNTKLITSL